MVRDNLLRVIDDTNRREHVKKIINNYFKMLRECIIHETLKIKGLVYHIVRRRNKYNNIVTSVKRDVEMCRNVKGSKF